MNRSIFTNRFFITTAKVEKDGIGLVNIFDEEKISETEFLVRRVKEVKPHMDNLHSWLLEKKQKEMILDSSKTKEAVCEHSIYMRHFFRQNREL